jgi:chromosome segregation ATPase
MGEQYPEHYNKEACELKHLQLEKTIQEIKEDISNFKEECEQTQDSFQNIDKKRDEKERKVEKDVRDQISTLRQSTDNKIDSVLCPIQDLLHDKKTGLLDRIENIEKILEKQEKDKEKFKKRAWKIIKWIINTILIIIVLYLGGRWRGVALDDIFDKLSNNTQQIENNTSQENISSGEKNE